MKSFTSLLFALFVMSLLLFRPGENLPAETAVPVAKKIRVLVVTGGHPYDVPAFNAFLASFPELEIEQARLPKDRHLLQPGLQQQFDVILLYDQDNTPLSSRQQNDFVSLLECGIGVFALHHHLSAHQDWDLHYDLIGGRDFWQKEINLFRGQQYKKSTFIDDVDIDIQVADPKHPITKGVSDFVINDEAYGLCPVHPDVHVILGSKHPKATPQVAWTWRFGKSPVFVNMLGHGPTAWNHPEFRRVFIQAIHWLNENRPPRQAPETGEKALPTKPGILLSFDDIHNISGWANVLPLFEKYGVKATFFINGAARLTSEQKKDVQKLVAAGNAIGSHGVNHADSVKYIKAKGQESFLNNEIIPNDKALRLLDLKPVSFAWPNGWYDDATDKAIAKMGYRHARGAKRYFPETGSLADEDRYFIPLDKITSMITFPGHGLDDIDEAVLERHIYPSLERAKKRNEIVVLYAHTIAADGRNLSIKPVILEKIFARVQKLGLVFYRFDDLP